MTDRFAAPHPEWIVPDWPAPARVRTLVTTRAGGVSEGRYASLNLGRQVGDDPRAVAENRARVTSVLPAPPVWLEQIHGSDVTMVHGVMDTPAADAAVTCQPDVVLAIQIADCLPVLLCNRAGTAVGAAHAGWRGLCAGVIENTVRAMRRLDKDLSIMAFLGPAIGPRNFAVGEEVRTAFVARDPDAASHFQPGGEGKWFADLYGLARQRLAGASVTEVYGGGYCTFAEPERFFSYRRDGVTGRMAALIWLA